MGRGQRLARCISVWTAITRAVGSRSCSNSNIGARLIKPGDVSELDRVADRFEHVAILRSPPSLQTPLECWSRLTVT